MKIFHINCNYMDSWLHQTMVQTLCIKNIDNSVFVPLYSLDGHIVKPEKWVFPRVCFNKWDRLFFHYKQYKIRKSILKEFDLNEYSVLHAYTMFTDGYNTRLLAKKFGKPYVVAVRNTDVNDFLKHMIHLRKDGIKVLLDAKSIFFLSQSYEDKVLDKYIPEKYRKLIKKKSHIIPNGIDPFWLHNKYLERNYEDIRDRLLKKEIRIIYAGAIDRNKNITLTCEAIKVLLKQGWKVDFSVVGKIRDESVFDEIKNQINYLGFMEKEELITHYRRADIFVMPSHAETFGLVYAEAMSQGLPVLYTRGQGFDGQFEDGYVGYAVSDIDCKDLVERILETVENYDSISQRTLKACSNYDWNQITERYIEIYNKL